MTPSASQKIYTPPDGKYFSKFIVNGDADLKAANVRKGVNIFGTIGTLVEGVVGIDFGTLTVSSSTPQIQISHNLGVVPTWAALIPSELVIGMINYSTPYLSANINGKSVLGGDEVIGHSMKVMDLTIDKESTSVTFKLPYKFVSTSYYWIAIA